MPPGMNGSASGHLLRVNSPPAPISVLPVPADRRAAQQAVNCHAEGYLAPLSDVA